VPSYRSAARRAPAACWCGSAGNMSLLRVWRFVGIISVLTTIFFLLRLNATLLALPSNLPTSAIGSTAVSVSGTSLTPVKLVTNWTAETALAMLRRTRRRYVIADVKNGLGNRLRALASAMSLAQWLGRPLLVVWVPDLHCNCSFTSIYEPPPFVVIQSALNPAKLSARDFQVYNYMRGEPGAFKDERVEVDPDRHLYFRSAYVMNHPVGQWFGGGPQREIQRLQPVDEVQKMLVADHSMIGIHVRNVFDAPRDEQTNKSVEGAPAVKGAEKEYGKAVADTLLQWRRAAHWSNFVPRITSLVKSANASRVNLRFYLAADSDEAYAGLTELFPDNIIYTRRSCETKRCDFRDCTSLVYSLVDMMNLARTRQILGSGYSSYSEVAAYLGGTKGKPLPILMAGRDFGEIVDKWAGRKQPGSTGASRDTSEQERDGEIAGFVPTIRSVKQFWPIPF